MARLLIDAGDASVLIDGGRVIATGRDAGIVGEGVERLLCGPEAVVRGGEVVAHTHLYSGLAPFGMPPPSVAPKNFLEILRAVWWRLDRALDAPSLRASARACIGDALLSGATALIDHHESPERIAGSLDVLGDAAQEFGIRLATGYGATERNRGRDEAKAGLAECERFAGANTRSLVRPLVALHASFTVSDDSVREAGALARRLGVPMHVHVAEDRADTADAKTRGYPGAFERLEKLGALPEGSILAHGVDLDDAAVRAISAGGRWLVQNPRSNRGNRVGWPFALAAAEKVALGNDGWAAQMLDEWAACSEVARENADQRVDAKELARRRAGGHALGSEIFGVPLSAHPHPGDAADVVVWERPGVAARTLANAFEDLEAYRALRAISPLRARHVVVAGRVVVRDGALLAAPMDGIRAEAEGEAAKLWARMAAIS